MSMNQVDGIYLINFWCDIKGDLSRVDLYHSSIKKIPETCFQSINGLFVIELSKNNLTTLHPNTFRGLTELKQLFLLNNQLTELNETIFDDLKSLTYLSLQNNSLQLLPKGLFKNLESLETLIVSGNQLQYVDKGTLPFYSFNLTYVDFSHNHLQLFPTDCLKLPRLQKCVCFNNTITLTNLQEVILEFDPMQMDVVGPLAFYGEPFTSYSQGAAHEVGQSEINLSRNNITSIPYNKNWSG